MSPHDRALSTNALESIDRLRRNTDFAWFMAEVAKRMDARMNRLLSPNCPDEGTLSEKIAVNALRQDVLDLLASLEAGHRAILGQTGGNRDD